MVTGPNKQRFDSELQNEIDDAISFIEDKLTKTAPNEYGWILFSMECAVSSAVRGIIKRKYEDAGWKKVEFLDRYRRDNDALVHTIWFHTK